jgi:hypothetical protein
MKILKMIKILVIDYKAGRIIRQLYKHQTTFVKIKENKREAAVRKGVKKGCNVSSLLFNIYIERAINEFKEYCTGMKVNGVRIQMLRFADDTEIIVQHEINLKKSIRKLR